MSIDRLIAELRISEPNHVSGKLDTELSREMVRRGLTSLQYRELLTLAHHVAPLTALQVVREAQARAHWEELGDYLMRYLMAVMTADPGRFPAAYPFIAETIGQLGWQLDEVTLPMRLVYQAMEEAYNEIEDALGEGKMPTEPTVPEVLSLLRAGVSPAVAGRGKIMYAGSFLGADAYLDQARFITTGLIEYDGVDRLSRTLYENRGPQDHNTLMNSLATVDYWFGEEQGAAQNYPVDAAEAYMQLANETLPDGLQLYVHHVPPDYYRIELNYPSAFAEREQ